jgi:hypothetical protein
MVTYESSDLGTDTDRSLLKEKLLSYFGPV